MESRVRLDIDLEALSHNLSIVRQKAPQQRILAMVKGNAYGHGIEQIAKTLADLGVEAFGVARISEVIALRKLGITQRIVLMSGASNPAELEVAARYDLELVVHHSSQVALLIEARLLKPIRIWLKQDTGMNRLGLSAEEFTCAYQQLASAKQIQKPLHLMTHLACADQPEKQRFTHQQITTFFETTHSLEGEKSVVNSAGLWRYAEALSDWVRPGLLLYGVSPFYDKMGASLGLKPVMTVTAPILAIKMVFPGETVGYGGHWTAKQTTPIGIVGIGYADGYPRSEIRGQTVWVAGQQCELVGRVSMDMLAINLSPCPVMKIGDRVTLWGAELPVETVAQHVGAIPYELLTRIEGSRIYTQRVSAAVQ